MKTLHAVHTPRNVGTQVVELDFSARDKWRRELTAVLKSLIVDLESNSNRRFRLSYRRYMVERDGWDTTGAGEDGFVVERVGRWPWLTFGRRGQVVFRITGYHGSSSPQPPTGITCLLYEKDPSQTVEKMLNQLAGSLGATTTLVTTRRRPASDNWGWCRNRK